MTQPSPEYQPPDGPNYVRQQPIQPKTNGFAIAALVLGISGGGLLAFIFGFVALGQLRKRGEKGKSMAVTGMVLGVAWMLVVCGYIGFVVNAPGSSGGKKVTTLRIGDCIEKPVDSYVTEVDLASCEDLHGAEVFGVSGLSTPTHPGNSELAAQAAARCAQLFRLDVDSARQGDSSIRVTYLIPTTADWDTDGARRIVCVAVSTGRGLSGSVLKSGG